MEWPYVCLFAMKSFRRYSGFLVASLPLATLCIAAGCGGSSGYRGVSVVPPTPDPSNPFRSVREYLNLDLENLPNYADPSFPVHYDATVRSVDNTPVDNPVTDRGATLGRVLFWDRRLSRNDTVSCASCHQQFAGFTDPRRFSTGFDGKLFGDAHTMRLGNIRFYGGRRMLWDGRVDSIEAQMEQPLTDPVEMGFDAANGGTAALLNKMAGLPYYPELFRWTYGDSKITLGRMTRAIAQYQRSMVSLSSRFDTEFAKVYDPALPGNGAFQRFKAFSDQQEHGKQLFLTEVREGGAGCVSCHPSPTFALDPASRGNGLDVGETRIFKSPSLKSVARSGVYMHDGRFETLEQVVDHYISGVQDGPALDNRLRGPEGRPQRLSLTTEDRDALVAFLKTLDDYQLATDPKFTDPFLK